MRYVILLLSILLYSCQNEEASQDAGATMSRENCSDYLGEWITEDQDIMEAGTNILIIDKASDSIYKIKQISRASFRKFDKENTISGECVEGIMMISTPLGGNTGLFIEDDRLLLEGDQLVRADVHEDYVRRQIETDD